MSIQLIDCPACGGKVSSQAAACPRCGQPMCPQAPHMIQSSEPESATPKNNRRQEQEKMKEETPGKFLNYFLVIVTVGAMIVGWLIGKPLILFLGLGFYGVIFLSCVVDAVKKGDIALLLCLIFIPVVGVFCAIEKGIVDE